MTHERRIKLKGVLKFQCCSTPVLRESKREDRAHGVAKKSRYGRTGETGVTGEEEFAIGDANSVGYARGPASWNE